MKVLLVDDHALIRDALRGVLKELVEDASVLEASDCRQAMALIESHPDLHLILLDLNLPDRDGFSVIADLRRRHATISLVVLSASHDRDTVMRALDLGALGFIPKSSPREVMVRKGSRMTTCWPMSRRRRAVTWVFSPLGSMQMMGPS